MMSAIQIDHLSKSYRKGWQRREVAAVRDISLTIPEGEAFGFIGQNGAGKSTTIRMLMGMSQPTNGTVKIFGISADEPISRRGVGYVPESPYLYDYLTPLELLMMGLRLHKCSLTNPIEHCMQWMERLALTHVSNAPIRTFSKGMMQRVAIAQALCINPRLLVLDEPLSGLDPMGRHEVVELLSEYKKNGGTIFFTSHVLHDVERLADRFGLIHQGEMRDVRSPMELVGEGELCVIRTLGQTAVEHMQEETPGRWIATIPRHLVWKELELLRDARHTLIEVRPILSLEQVFMQVIGR